MYDRVLIIGAGIGGLTLAYELQRRNIAVIVAEQSPSLSAAGAGIVLHPNALVHLQDLRTGLLANGCVIERQRNTDSGGRVSELEWSEVWGPANLPLAIHRRRLAELLLARLKPETVRWSTKLVSLQQSDGYVDALVHDTRRGSASTLRGCLVIGADGVHSSVRPFVDADAISTYLGQTYWRFTVPATIPFAFSEWRVFRSERAFFGGMPVGGDRMHVFLQLHTDAPLEVSPAEALDQLVCHARTIGPAAGELASAIALDESVHVGPARGTRCSKWSEHRVAILGDAAHAVSPIMTQGGAMAIEDAVVLAEEVHRRGTSPDALRAFETRRRPRVEYVSRMSRVHLMLIDKALPIAGPTLAVTTADRTIDWLRRLYAPLKEAA